MCGDDRGGDNAAEFRFFGSFDWIDVKYSCEGTTMGQQSGESCESCRFFDRQAKLFGWGAAGERRADVCRRHPPTHGAVITQGDWWCGEYRPVNDIPVIEKRGGA